MSDTRPLDSTLARFGVHAFPNPLLVVASDGTIVDANDQLHKLFGYEAGELRGQLVEVLVPDAARAHHHELRSAFMELPAHRSMGSGRELFGITKTGAHIPLEISLAPVERGGSTWVLVSVLDTSQRVSAESKIRKALDAVSNAVVMIDGAGNIVLVNTQATAMFGYVRSAMLGQPIEMLVPERYRRRHRVFRTSYMTSQHQRQMGEGKELFGMRQDGTEFPIEIGLTPIRTSDGVLFMSTIMNLTDRRREELETRARNQQLSSLNAELTQFAYSTSHDLKAPLTSIAGLLQVATEDLDDGDLGEVRANLQKAQGLATQLAQRIEDMLAIAKAGDGDGDRSLVDLDELVASTWDALSASVEDAPALSVEFRHEGAVLANPAMLGSVIENLLGNALKFADADKDAAEVTVRSCRSGSMCEVTVADNGIGIPTENHHEVFQMFKRFSNVHAGNNPRAGSGMGLALVKKYVTVMGGEIRFESSPEGTTFAFTIPLADAVVGARPYAGTATGCPL